MHTTIPSTIFFLFDRDLAVYSRLAICLLPRLASNSFIFPNTGIIGRSHKMWLTFGFFLCFWYFQFLVFGSLG